MSKGRITKEQLSDSLLSFITQNAGSGSGGPSTIEFKKNSVTVESSTNRVAIGISGFNKSSDLLMVYKNSVYLEENVIYTVSSDNLYIQKIDGNWNETGTSVFNFVVIKGGASSSGGSNGVPDGSITKAKLANELQNKIDEIDVLSQKDIEISSQLKQKANIKTKNVTGSTEGYFKAPVQPSFSEGDGEIINNNDYNEIINKLDKYVDGSYIKKELLGKDTTNTHNIYRYIVEPEKYSKTIVLISGQHGNEKVGVYTIARLFHHLTDEETYLKYPQISEIRNNVRLIIIPFANPAGYVAHTRNNGNGVDINRNYDYRWSKNSGDKGASAFSEKETQYIRDTIDRYKNDTCFVIDYHNFVGSGQGQKYVCWTNKFTTNVLNDIQKYIRTNESDLSKIDVRVGGTASSLDNYTNIHFQIPAITAENADLLRGNKFYDGLELQYSLTWLVNLIMIGYKKAEQRQSTNVLEPFAKVVHYRCPTDYSKGLKVEATSSQLLMKDFEELKIEFDIPCHGILEVTGVATVYSTDTQDQVKVVGVLGQYGGEIKGDESWYDTVFGVLEESPYNRYNTSMVMKRSIPFTTCIRVIPSDRTVGKGYFYPRIGATWHTNYLASLKATVKFTPSNHGLANEIIDIYPSDGVEGTSTSFTQGKIYPDIVY